MRFRREDAEALMQCLERVPGVIAALTDRERPPSEVVDFLDPLSREALAYLYVLGGPSMRRLVERYVKTWKHTSPEISGHDLAVLGLKPSRAYAEILSRVRAEKLDGKVKGREEELALAKRLVRERRGG
jgi:tRNA nucleotidyltransferase (CCA-adding enzyme)